MHNNKSVLLKTSYNVIYDLNLSRNYIHSFELKLFSIYISD